MKIDRPGAAIIGAVPMVAFRIVGPGEAVASIDFSTIVLLFSMMPIVANLHGAVRTVRMGRSRMGMLNVANLCIGARC